MSRMLRRLLRAPAVLYQWRCGWLLGRRFLLLTHVGRRTGRRHHTVLEVVEHRREGSEAVVVSAFGRAAGWLRNIEAAPGSAEVAIASQRFIASHRILDEAEAVAVLRGYLRRNRWVAPLIRLVLGRFLGWKFDGSVAHCRRAAAQLPLVALRPREPGGRPATKD